MLWPFLPVDPGWRCRFGWALLFAAVGKKQKVETGCRDCQKCTNSALANLGRNTGRATTAMFTLGMSEVGFKMRKECRACGHQMSLHGRQGTSEVVQTRSAPVSAPVRVSAPPAPPARPAAPQGPPPGWYNDPQGVAGQRWWDGTSWTEHTNG